MADTLVPDKGRIDEQALDTRQTLKYAEDLVLAYDALRASERRYRALWHIGKSLHQYVSLDDLISHAIQETREAMNAVSVSVSMYDNQTDEWIICRQDGVSGPISKEPRVETQGFKRALIVGVSSHDLYDTLCIS
jgi:nitrate/nitrite-specific signal transduction histidine kinase